MQNQQEKGTRSVPSDILEGGAEAGFQRVIEILVCDEQAMQVAEVVGLSPVPTY